MFKISIKSIGLFLGPVLFYLVLQLQRIDYLPQEGWKVLAVAAWMLCWWISEATAMAVAALLPIVLFPALGVMNLSSATAPYASPIIFLFMGGFFLALGLEQHNLHKRIALNLIRLTGTSSNGIILGFMISTAFLSMWISNTATAVMMLPIATSVISLIEHSASNKRAFGLFSASLMLSIAYSANIGGMGTIIGTPPNVVFVGYAKELMGIDIDFSSWLLIGIPLVIILLLVTYLILTKVLFRSNLGKIENADQVINNEIAQLGPMSREEKFVAVVFALTAMMWIFKRPINLILGEEILNDTATAMIGGILTFAVPLNIKKGEFLVPWEATKRLPWGILLLFGGGMSLAKAMESTGLIQIIADTVSSSQLSIYLVFLILIAAMAVLTEIMSNVALATIFIPVVIGIGQGTGINPLLLSIPVALAASCAFMMPISTPPNAIVFSSGHIRFSNMLKAGIVIDAIAVLILWLSAFSLIHYVFG